MNVIISTERLGAGVAADLRKARAARGYSLEDVAETCGLTVDEIEAIEAAQDMDSRKLARVAAAVGLPRSHSFPR
ncbi:helix-turn-helix domain-containing protein [Rhizobium sp. S152]|uniref:helix-turn-helix domain-containing protein n=1 Tax=Rhizobium sp. S152 TaxID=3055038 RepID=UPI0025A999C9|nr:helix-turn-helix domain-containing protein [Rhizobium sp. S152]MDM9628467.1 helix-turn-helix domain-containing protein [Rhizobium sp. S152]